MSDSTDARTCFAQARHILAQTESRCAAVARRARERRSVSAPLRALAAGDRATTIEQALANLRRIP
jgi:hypothetical protein